MKCSKCHRDATKKIQLEDGFLPCCDSYDCNLLLRFELIKPQINNAVKSIIVVLALLTFGCNVANDANESKACDVLITEAPHIIGSDRYLICGIIEDTPYVQYQITDITYYSFIPSYDRNWTFPDTLIITPMSPEDKEITLNSLGEYLSIWVNLHDEAYTYQIAN